MKIYTLIGGLNGSGKSSLSGVLKSQLDDLGKIIDVDEITRSVNGNKLKAGKIAVKMIDEFIGKGLPFAQETTLSGKRVEKTVRKAIDSGYIIRLFYVGLDDITDNIERIRNRVKKGGHDIPEEDVKRRFNKRFSDLNAILPYCREAVFYDNNNGFVEVAEYKNGEVISKGGYKPKWLQEFLDYRSEADCQIK